jgi:predicted Zn-dependent protease
MPHATTDAFTVAFALWPKPWAVPADEVLERANRAGEASPFATSVLVRRLARRRLLEEAKAALAGLAVGSPGWESSAAAYIEELGLGGVVWEHLIREFRDAHADALRRPALTWGMMGFALVNAGRYADAIAWLHDWEKRTDARPWMLSNLANPLRRLGLDAAAARVTLHALTLPPDPSTLALEAWSALDAALEGQHDRARSLLDRLAARKPEATGGFVTSLAHAVLAAAAGDFAGARRKRKDALRVMPRFRTQDAAAARAHDRAVRRIGKAAGGVAGALWRAWVWSSSGA